MTFKPFLIEELNYELINDNILIWIMMDVYSIATLKAKHIYCQAACHEVRIVTGFHENSLSTQNITSVMTDVFL